LANFALTDAFLLINAVNMSAMARKVTVKTLAAELDNTAFGATYHSRIGGLKDWSVDIEWNQDMAAAQVDATLFPLLGTVVAFEARETSAARSATNPAWTGNILIADYTPMDNQVGELAKATVSWKGAGALTHPTS
jgi:hypothetical protein